FYEHYVLSIPRVGVATNPIPYALYVSFLILSCIYFLLKNHSNILKIISLIGGLLSLAAIIMTDVRGVILFLPAAVLYLIIAVVKPKLKHYIVLCFSVIAVSISFYTFFKQDIDAR